MYGKIISTSLSIDELHYIATREFGIAAITALLDLVEASGEKALNYIMDIEMCAEDGLVQEVAELLNDGYYALTDQRPLEDQLMGRARLLLARFDIHQNESGDCKWESAGRRLSEILGILDPV